MKAALLVLVFGSATVPIGFVYAAILYFLPFVYMNLVVLLFVGVLVGFLMSRAAKLARLWNPKVAALGGLIFGAITVYSSWVAHLYLLEAGVVFDPRDMLAIQRLLAENGVWEVFGWTPRGAALLSIWAIEAALLLALPPCTAALINKEDAAFPPGGVSFDAINQLYTPRRGDTAATREDETA